jgi:hypothetical protein
MHRNIEREEVSRDGNYPMSLQLRKIVRELNDNPIIYKAHLSHKEIRIKYMNGLVERWVRDEKYLGIGRWQYLLPEDIGKIKYVPLEPLYELNRLDDDYDIKKKHFIIKYNDYEKMPFVTKRLIVQKAVDNILEEGLKVKHPEKDLLKDFIDLKSDNIDRFKKGVIYKMHCIYGVKTKGPGQKLIQNYTDDEYKADRAFDIYRVITNLLRNKRDITKSVVMSYTKYSMPPNYYRAIFSRFKLKSNIADLIPSYSKAIAAAMLNCNYDSDLDTRDLTAFLGIESRDISRDIKYDTVILEHDNIDYDLLYKWIGRSKNQLVFVPKEEYEKFTSMFDVLDSIKIDIHFSSHIETEFYDYLVLI